MAKKRIAHTIHWHKEILLLILALASVGLLVYEEITKPKGRALELIDIFDIFVAFVFLIDFFVLLKKSQQKLFFLKHNWYLLVASIPLYSGWAEVLRSLRILRFIKLIRFGEHLEYGYKQVKL